LETAFIILLDDLDTDDEVESFPEKLDTGDVDSLRGDQTNGLEVDLRKSSRRRMDILESGSES
jgi:hypothetical protein